MARNPPTELKCDKSTNRAFVRWHGKKIYFGQWGSPASRKAFAQWLADQHAEPTNPAPRSRLTVVQCVEQYLYHAQVYYSNNGKRTGEFGSILTAMKLLVAHAPADTDYADEFGPRRLAAIQKEMEQQEVSQADKSRKFCRNTINSRIQRIRRCFRWCASQELIPASIATALEMVPDLKSGRTTARETKPVRPVEIEAVIATLPYLSPTVSAMVRIQLLCGMRPQDVRRMTGDAIDMTGDVWMYRPAEHKMTYRGQSLVKAIPRAAQQILQPFLRQDPAEPLFSATDAPGVRQMARRIPYPRGSYSDHIGDAIDRAAKDGVSIPRWTPNQLRHLIATVLRASSGIESAQLFLGHTKPDTTLIYAEQSEEKLKQIARDLVSPLSEEPRKPR